MNIDNFVIQLERERKGLVKVIKKINKLSESEQESDKARRIITSLDPEVFSEENKLLFLWNALQMNGRKRYSGKPYFVHPASVATLAGHLVPKAHRDTVIGYSLIHDLIDEALRYDAELFRKVQHVSQGIITPDQLRASVLLSGPEPFGDNHIETKLFTVEQIKRHGNPAHAYTLLLDKIDSQLDLKYLKGINKSAKKGAITRWFVAYPLYALGEVNSMVTNEFSRAIRNITAWTIKKEGLSRKDVHNCITDYCIARDYNQERLTEGIQKHQERFKMMF